MIRWVSARPSQRLTGEWMDKLWLRQDNSHTKSSVVMRPWLWGNKRRHVGKTENLSYICEIVCEQTRPQLNWPFKGFNDVCNEYNVGFFLACVNKTANSKIYYKWLKWVKIGFSSPLFKKVSQFKKVRPWHCIYCICACVWKKYK